VIDLDNVAAAACGLLIGWICRTALERRQAAIALRAKARAHEPWQRQPLIRAEGFRNPDSPIKPQPTGGRLIRGDQEPPPAPDPQPQDQPSCVVGDQSSFKPKFPSPREIREDFLP
jgi:hypothetical protein